MDTNVATVNKDGKVTAKANGTTLVKVYNQKNNIYASVKINVNGKDNISYPKVSGGYNHFVALKADGKVYSWGLNKNGQLGTNDYTSRNEPTKMVQILQDEDGEEVKEEVSNVIAIKKNAAVLFFFPFERKNHCIILFLVFYLIHDR